VSANLVLPSQFYEVELDLNFSFLRKEKLDSGFISILTLVSRSIYKRTSHWMI